MTARCWWLRRVRAAGEDRGASLLLALIFITVISVAVVGMLTLAFANLRATTALREQAAAEAAADGAAQVAINALRRGDFSCAGAPNALQVPPAPGGTFSAAVRCAPDPTNSQGSAHPDFPWALLTLPTGGENGMSVYANGPSNDTPVVFAGNVGSTGHVFADRGIIDITSGGTLSAATCAISNQGTIRINATAYTSSLPPGCGSPPADPDPEPDLPAADPPSATNPLPTYRRANGDEQFNTTCVTTGQPQNRTARIEFSPGRYTNPNSLNAASTCAAGSDLVIEFEPGEYWFDFPAATPWSVTGGTLTAGCGPGEEGVVFIFGGESQWTISGRAQVQVCGRRPEATGPPPAPGNEPPAIAIYGLRDLTFGTRAQTGCVVIPSNAAGACRTLRIIGNNSAMPRVNIEGATYLPLGWIDIDLQGNGTYEGSFDGIVARRFSLHSQNANLTFSSTMSTSPPGPQPARSVVDLAVYVCPGDDPCDIAGAARLTAKVALIEDEDGRQVSIYAWNAAT